MKLQQKLSAASGRLGVRLVAGLLVASLPVTIVLAVVLTEQASSSLTRSTETNGVNVAHATAGRVSDWMGERTRSLEVVASGASGRLGDPATGELLARTQARYPGEFASLQLTDLNGASAASVGSVEYGDVASQDWFRTAASGQRVVTSPVLVNGRLVWIVAEPVVDAAGRPEGVLVADLNVSAVPAMLLDSLAKGEEVEIADAKGRVLYNSSMGEIADESALLAAGSMKTVDGTPAVSRALAGGRGSLQFTHDDGRPEIAGYDGVEGLNWAVVVSQPADQVLAPVAAQRRVAVVLLVVGIVAIVGYSIVFARRTTRPIVELADAAEDVATGRLDVRVDSDRGAIELRRMGEAFNRMVERLATLVTRTSSASTEVNASAAELSASSEELAATTTQQSAAVTEASATTEELARASASIAETVGDVAAQAAETRDNLERAEADIQASSERTLSLADRVNQIGVILTLINEIADQTNLLALNAAIEAARAGEGGKGFAVVAEEVRRLAERSKSSAAEIAVITEGVHAETNATVMAMEKGANQMQRGLALLEEVTQAAEQVRLTTQQQRSATGQVVETMEQLTDASRQVSATAQQIAGASASLAELAGNLEKTAELTTVG